MERIKSRQQKFRRGKEKLLSLTQDSLHADSAKKHGLPGYNAKYKDMCFCFFYCHGWIFRSRKQEGAAAEGVVETLGKPCIQ